MKTDNFEIVKEGEYFFIKPLNQDIGMPDWVKGEFPTPEGALERAKVLEQKIKEDTTGCYKVK